MSNAKIETGPKKIKLILKADNAGALEALSDVIKSTPSVKESIEILNQSVGRVNESDFKLAISAQAIIIGFRVKLDQAVENSQRFSSVTVIISEIIYELLKKLEDYLNSFDKLNLVGELEILAIFSAQGKKQVIGGRISGDR